MMGVDWQKKIAALLHDPPAKALGIKGHEEKARELVALAVGQEVAGRLLGDDVVKRADWWSSGADRINFPAEVQVNWASWPRLTHPLCGREMNLESLSTVDSALVNGTIAATFDSLVSAAPDDKAKFLRLWRGLPDRLILEEKKNPAQAVLGELWKLLPAETRIPDHSIWQHTRLAAAFAGALPKPAFLLFTIGPVQSFISTARRLQDLWMASYMLSWLMWCGLIKVCEDYGPDSVIYPNLHGNGLVDRWLEDKGCMPGEVSPEDSALAFAAFPNRALILLPELEAEDAAEKMETSVHDCWLQMAAGVKRGLEEELGVDSSGWSDLWDVQPTNFFQVYWSIYRWPVGTDSYGKPDAALEEYKGLVDVGEEWSFEDILKTLSEGGKYTPNVGACYSLVQDLAKRGLEARRMLRIPAQRAETGEKCTLCGERQALCGDGYNTRDFWKRFAQQLHWKAEGGATSRLRGHSAAIKPDGRERLCTVCTIKRFVQPLFFSERLGLEGGFPSTSTIATAYFKEKIIENFSTVELRRAVKGYVQALEKLGFPRTASPRALPLLQRKCKNDPLATTFLEYDGDALFQETLTVKRLKDDYGLSPCEADVRQARQELAKLLKVCEQQGISQPARYYAVMQMDGDNLGQWLSGVHEKMPLYRDVLHSRVRQVLGVPERYSTWGKVLDSPRWITPSLHAFISEALCSFGTKLSRYVVEKRYPARLIYAGGDDLLIVVPADYMMNVARELRALFSGEAEIFDNGDIEVHFGTLRASGYLRLGKELVMTMGPNATASMGVAISHHRQPLSVALSAAREAVQRAKDYYGRNAICVTVLKRSGERLDVGAKWFYNSGENTTEIVDTLGTFLGMRQLFLSKRVALSFPYDLHREAHTLSGVPLEGQKAELQRLWQRHAKGSSDNGALEEVGDRLQKLLTAFVCEQTSSVTSRPGVTRLAEWLLVTRFIASGGE